MCPHVLLSALSRVRSDYLLTDLHTWKYLGTGISEENFSSYLQIFFRCHQRMCYEKFKNFYFQETGFLKIGTFLTDRGERKIKTLTSGQILNTCKKFNGCI